MERFAGIGRPAQNWIPTFRRTGMDSPVTCRLVEHGGAVRDRAIDRHHVAFADHETIARLDRLQRNLLQPAVALSKGSTRHAGQQRRHLTAGATLGEALEILPARIHHRDDGRGQVFRKHKSREHGERGDDVQTHIAATQSGDDLGHEDDKSRRRGRSPYRSGPMFPSEEMRCEFPEPARSRAIQRGQAAETSAHRSGTGASGPGRAIPDRQPYPTAPGWISR